MTGLRSSLAFWLAWSEWRAQPLRNALSVVAIAVGVALGFAIHLVNAVALEHFTGGLNQLRGAADLSLVATDPGGFDEAYYATLLAGPAAAAPDPAIDVASPIVERDVLLADDPSTALHVTGLDALRAVRVTPFAIGRPDGGARHDESTLDLRWLDPDAVWLPAAFLRDTNRQVGDALAVRVDGDVVALRIAGFLDDQVDDAPPATRRPDARRTVRATMDIASAQWRLHRLGRLSRIDVRLAPGTDVAALRRSLAPMLPRDVRVADAADDRERSGDLSRAYRVNLDMLALMALFTGAFLVYSTQSLAVARRRAQLALLRVIGATRRRVVAQVLVEGALQGIVGGVAGLVIGVAFAATALRFFGGDLGGGYFGRTGLDLRSLVLAAPVAAGLFFVLGLAAALAGSFFPARAAVRAAPAVALKSAGSDEAPTLSSPWPAVILLASGLACALLPAWNALPVAGYVAMALLLFGGIAAMPWVARTLLSPFARRLAPKSIALDLALRRLWAAPSAASVALCGIVASASLMVAMTVMIASFRESVDAWLGQLLSADLYLRTDAAAGGLSPVDVERLAKVDGVARIDLQKTVPLTLSATRPAVTLIVRTVDRTRPSGSIPLIREVATDPAAGTPVWVSEAMLALHGAHLGQPLRLPIGDGRFVVAGVWRDYARQFGSVIVRREDWTRLTGDARFTDAAVELAHGASAAAVTTGLRDALPAGQRERAEFAEPGAIRALSLQIFDRSFAVTYLLQAVAIAIGLAGVAATFSAQTLARAKEFGMLRHIGVLRRQIIGELASEGALLGILGALAGGVLGLAMSQVLIHVVNPQSFHWTMDTTIPWRTLSLVGLALVAAAAGTAVLSGRRALRHDAVLAVREDW